VGWGAFVDCQFQVSCVTGSIRPPYNRFRSLARSGARSKHFLLRPTQYTATQARFDAGQGFCTRTRFPLFLGATATPAMLSPANRRKVKDRTDNRQFPLIWKTQVNHG